MDDDRTSPDPSSRSPLRLVNLPPLVRGFVDRGLSFIGRGDVHMREVVRGASIAFTLRVVGAALSFTANVVLARLLGAEGAGIYYLAFTVTAISTVVGRLGLDNSLLRFSAATAAQEEWDRLAGLYRKGMGIATIAAGVISVVVALGAPSIAAFVFDEPDLTAPLRVMALSIVPFSLLTLYGELLKGLGRIRDAMLVDAVGIPVVHLPLLFLLAGPYGVVGAATSYAASTAVVLVAGRALWLRAAPQVRRRRGSFDTRLLLRTSLPLFWVASLYLVMGWTDNIMLGIFADSRAVGIYSVAFRTALLTKFLLLAVNSVVAPKFAALHAQGEFEALALLARRSARFIGLLAAPVLLLFVLLPRLVLLLYGGEFLDGDTALRILAAGQFVSAAAGSVGYLLMMSGHERALRDNVFRAAVFNVAANLILIPRLGATGAAAATAASIAFQNIGAVYLVRKHLGIRVW